MKEWIKFNLNDCVKVRLTERGKEMIKEYYNTDTFDWFEGNHEGDGYYRFQLHELASVFGEKLHFGKSSSLPFETNLYFSSKDKENNMKCKCERFKRAVKEYEIRAEIATVNCHACGSQIAKQPSEVKYTLCAVEGIETTIYFCPWCGGTL